MHELSFWGMFLQAGLIVKFVMIMLVLASVYSWSIIINKIVLYRKVSSHIKSFEQYFWSGQPLDEMYRAYSNDKRFHHTTAAIFLAGMREWRRSRKANAHMGDGLNMRVSKVMDITLNKEADRLESGLSTLATIGSASPFVGLFGTVWGIMTAFQAIAVSQNTNLAAVAPGIAEALLATALGLVAAIPAVIAYNRLLVMTQKITLKMEGFSDEFAAMISRQLDSRG